MTQEVKNHWEKRYDRDGILWGWETSQSVKLFARWLYREKMKRILIVGCGYGRGAKYLAQCGFHVDAIDASPTAIRLFQEQEDKHPNGLTEHLYPNHVTAWVEDAVFLDRVESGRYDAIVADKLWHLLDESERNIVRTTWSRVVKKGGMICCNAFAQTDASYQQGVEIAPNTWRLPDGKVVYFTSTEAWPVYWQALGEMVEDHLIIERYPSVELHFHISMVRV